MGTQVCTLLAWKTITHRLPCGAEQGNKQWVVLEQSTLEFNSTTVQQENKGNEVPQCTDTRPAI